jgi:tetratricopeptide (TPR) repeat protein
MRLSALLVAAACFAMIARGGLFAAPPTSAQLLARAVDVAATIPEETQRQILLFRFAHLQFEIGDTAGAQHTSKLLKPAVFRGMFASGMLHNVAVQQATLGDVAGARATAEGIERVIDKAAAFADIAIIVAERGELAEARKIVDGIKVDGVIGQGDKNKALTKIAVQQIKANKLAAALATVDGVQGAFEKEASWVELVSALCDAGLLADASALTHRFAGKTHRAEAFARLGAAQAKAHDRTAAAASFQKAKQAANELDIDNQMPLAWIAVGNGQAAAKDPDSAASYQTAIRRTLAMRDEGMYKSQMLGEVAVEQARTGDLTAALATLDLSVRLNLGAHRSRAIERILKRLLDAGEFEKAQRVIKSLEDDQLVRSQGELILAKSQARSGRRDEARKTVEKIVAFVSAMNADNYSRLGWIKDLAEAQAAIGDAATALKTLAPFYDRDKTVVTAVVAAAQAAAGDVEGASQWVNRLEDPILQANGLAGIASGLFSRTEAGRRAAGDSDR